jgi:hypothetical protein
MKVVINKCYGGFGLSHEAMLRYAEIKGITVYPEESGYGFVKYYTVPVHQRTPEVVGVWHELPLAERQRLNDQWRSERINDLEIPRNDDALVQVVEELGSKKASGRFAELKIVNIPDGIDWEVDEYDGLETVVETHRSWG